MASLCARAPRMSSLEAEEAAMTARLPTGWAAFKDESSGAFYFCNQYSGSTQWELPTEPANPKDQDQQHSEFYAEKIRSATAAAPSKPSSGVAAAETKRAGPYDSKLAAAKVDDEDRRARMAWIAGGVTGLCVLAIFLGVSLGIESSNGSSSPSASSLASVVVAEGQQRFEASVDASGSASLTDDVLGTSGKVSSVLTLSTDQAPSSRAFRAAAVRPLVSQMSSHSHSRAKTQAVATSLDLTGVTSLGTSSLSSLSAYFPTFTSFSGFGDSHDLSYTGGPTAALYACNVSLYGQSASCVFGLMVGDLSSNAAASVLDVVLVCNLSSTASFSHILGLSNSDVTNKVTQTCVNGGCPSGAASVIAFATESFADSASGYQFLEGINLATAVSANAGQMLAVKDYFSNTAYQTLNAYIPLGFTTATNTSCPDVTLDVSYVDSEFTLNTESGSKFSAKNALIRALDGQLACNPDDTKLAFSFDLETASGTDVDLSLEVYNEFNSTSDLESTFNFSAAVKNASFTVAGSTVTVVSATARVLVKTNYKKFQVKEVYLGGTVTMSNFAVTEATFAGRYTVVDSTEFLAVYVEATINIDSINTLICQISSGRYCSTLSALDGISTSGTLAASIAFGNAGTTLNGRIILDGIVAEVSTGLTNLPSAVDSVVSFLGSPSMTGYLRVTYLWAGDLIVSLGVDFSTPTVGNGVSTPSSVISLTSVQVDVAPLTATVSMTAILGLNVGSDVVYFSITGGFRSASELFVSGRMTSVWRDVAGVSGLTIANAGLEVGITAGPAISTLGIWATIKLGSISFNGTIYFSATDSSKYVVYATLESLTMDNIISAAEQIAGTSFPAVVTNIVSQLLNIKVYSAKLYIAPSAMTLFASSPSPISVSAGFEVWANMSLFNADVVVSLKYASSGSSITLFGASYPIPDFTFGFSLTNAYATDLIPGWSVANKIMDKVSTVIKDAGINICSCYSLAYYSWASSCASLCALFASVFALY